MPHFPNSYGIVNWTNGLDPCIQKLCHRICNKQTSSEDEDRNFVQNQNLLDSEQNI